MTLPVPAGPRSTHSDDSPAWKRRECSNSALPTSLSELIASVTTLLADATEPDLDLDGVMEVVCTHAQRLTGASGAVVEIADGLHMVYRATTGSLAPHVGMQLLRNGSLSGRAIETGEVQICEDSETDPRVDRVSARRVGARSMLLVPLTFSGLSMGVLKVISAEVDAFCSEQVQALHLLAGVLGVAIKRGEDRQMLRESEEWFRTLIERSTDMFAVLSLGAVYTYCSPSVGSQLGYDTSELIGRNAFDLVHHDDVSRIRGEVTDALHTAPYRAAMTMRFRHKEGGWRECDVNLRVIANRAGTRMLIVTARDVTESRRLERQLADAERLVALGRVATSMAHEFNNVLMGIQPQAEVIVRSRDQARITAAAERIQAAVKRGKSITQQVLRYTRSELPTRRAVKVSDILDHVRQELQPLLPHNMLISVEQQEDLWVLADDAQIGQTVVNLCLNARDAMPGGGVIAIHAAASDAHQYPYGALSATSLNFIRITVSDTGSGIPAELRERIFEPLFTTRKHEGGTGLGLSVARNTATFHEGALFVESEVGSGTNLHLFLVQTPPYIATPAPVARVAALAVQRVLLVEDDDEVATGLELILEEFAGATHRVTSGGEAPTAVMRFNPDLVLVDYGLPDMSGASVYRALRARWPALPIVFMTGHADGQIVRREIGTEDVHICFKPFETADLLAAIRSAVRVPSPIRP